MAKLKWQDGKWIDKATGKESPAKNSFDFSRPWGGNIAEDYADYECPVSGKVISGRKAHSENLKVTGCRLLEKGEREDNEKRGKRLVEAENRRMDRAIDGIVDQVAKDYL